MDKSGKFPNVDFHSFFKGSDSEESRQLVKNPKSEILIQEI